MPPRTYPKKPYVKIDFAKKHRNKVTQMYDIIKNCKRIGRASLIEELEVTPTKFYFVQRDCLELNPIQHDKKIGLYLLALRPEYENGQIVNEIRVMQSDLAKIQKKSGYELSQQETEIISTFTKKPKLEEKLTA